MQRIHLEVFLAVVREGSFSGAATSLFLAPSRVTERIQQLERELQTPLLDRSRRGLVPTQAGLALVPRAEAIVREFELIRMLFPAPETADLRVGVRSLPPDIRQVIQSRLRATVGPDRLSILPLESTSQIDRIVAGSLECGFIWTTAPPSLRSFPVLAEELAIVLPANHPAASLPVVSPEDITGLALASVVDPLSVPADLTAYLERLPRSDVVNPAVAGALYLMVSGGRHCAFVGRSSTEHHALSEDTRRNIIIKPMLQPAPVLRTHFVWHPDLEANPGFVAVLAAVRQEFPVELRR